MLLRHALITFVICIVLCPTTAAIIVLCREDWSLYAFANTYIYTSIGLAVLGALGGVGASSGGDTRSVDSASMNATEYARQDNQDAVLGIGFGWVLFLAGLPSFGAAYLLYRIASS